MLLTVIRTSAFLLLFSLVLGANTQTSGNARLPDSSSYEDVGQAENLDSSGVEYLNSGPLGPLYDFLIRHGLQRLCNLLRKANLEAYLVDAGPLTIFAPLDGSFAFLPGGTLDELERNPRLMQEFLLHHFVAGDIASSQILDEMEVISIQGSPLRFNIYGPQDVITVSGAEILEPDLQFDLGRLFIIDRPLYPLPDTDLLGYIQSNCQEFYKLIFTSGLSGFLSGGTFTVLAPDDRSFDYLSVDLKDALARNQSLAEVVVLSHVLPASIFVRGVANGIQMQSVGGTDLLFTQRRGLTFVNGIPLVQSDVPTIGGVVHTINRVILPEGVENDCHCKPLSDKRGQPKIPGQPRRPSTQGRPPSIPAGRPSVSLAPRPGIAQRPVSPTRAPPTGRGTPTPGRQIPGTIPGGIRGGGNLPRGRPGTVHGTRPIGGIPGQGQTDVEEINVIQGQDVVTTRPRVDITQNTIRRQTPVGTRVTTPSPGRVKRPLSPPINTQGQRQPIRPGITQQPQVPGRVGQPPRTHVTQTPGIPEITTELELEEVLVDFGTTAIQPGSRIPQQPGRGRPTQRPQGRQPIRPVGQGQRSTVSPPQRIQPAIRNQFQTTTTTPFVAPEFQTEFIDNFVDTRTEEFEFSRNGFGQPTLTQPGRPTPLRPSQPTQTQPGRPVVIDSTITRPGQPTQTRPGQPTPERPIQTSITRPGQPSAVQPGQPSPGRPTITRPGQPSAIQPGQPTPSRHQRPLPQPGQRPGPSYISQPASIPQPPRRTPLPQRPGQPVRFPVEFDDLPGPQSDFFSDNQQTPPAVISTPSRRPQPSRGDTSTNVIPGRRPVSTLPPRRQVSTFSTTSLFPTQRPGTRRTSHETKGQPFDPQRHPQQRRPTGRLPNNPSSRNPVPPPGRNTLNPSRQPSSSSAANYPENCRRQGERVNDITRSLLLCPEPEEPCQRLDQPYNPRDPRPRCQDNRLNCRNPAEVADPLDTRPLCDEVNSLCREPNDPLDPNNPLPLCSPHPSGCRRPDEPFTPQDRRPLCSQRNTDNPGCRLPQERPLAGDTRPICRNPGVRQNPRPQPQPQPPQSTSRNNVPGRRPSPQVTNVDRPTGCRQFGEVPELNDRRPLCPVDISQEITTTTRLPQLSDTQRPNQGLPGLPPLPAIDPISGRPPSNQQQPSPGVSTCRPPNERLFPGDRRPLCQPTQRPIRGNPPTSNQRTSVNRIQSQIRGTSRPVQPPEGQPDFPSDEQCRYPGEPIGVGDTRPLCSTEVDSNSVLTDEPESPQRQVTTRPLTNVRQQPGQRPWQQQPPGSTRITTTTTTTGQISNQAFGNRDQQHTQIPVIPTRTQGHQRVTTTSSRTPGNQRVTSVTTSTRNQGNQRITTTTRTSVGPTSRRPNTNTATSTGPDEPRSLYQIVEDPALLIQGRPVKLNKIFELFHKAGLDYILTDPGPHTVFFPSDDAFLKLPKGVVEQLESNPELLQQVLLFHITTSEILPAGREESYSVPSLQGTPLLITMVNRGRMILISGAKAVAVTRANNGIFYVVNELLYPMPQDDIVSALDNRPDLSQLTALARVAGLEDMLKGDQPYTLFAPTDNAFQQISDASFQNLMQNSTAARELLLGHIIEGAHYGREFLLGGMFPSLRGPRLRVQVVSFGYQVNNVNIKTPEIVTGTGVIHLIDDILLTPEDMRFLDMPQNTLEGPLQDNGLDRPGSARGSPPGNELNSLPGSRNPGTPGQRSGNTPSNAQGHDSTTHRSPSPARGSPSPVTSGPASLRHTLNSTPQTHSQGATHSRNGGGVLTITQVNPGTRTTTMIIGRRTVSHSGTRTQTSAGHRQMVLGNGGTSGMVGHYSGVAQLASDIGLTRFADWITNSGLQDKIQDGGTYTVFAPTDEALNSLPQDVVDGFYSNPDSLRNLLSFHIVPQKLSEKSVRNDETSSTLLQGKKLRFNLYHDGQIRTALGVPVDKPQDASAQVKLVPVNQVLQPPTGNLMNLIESSPELTEFTQAIKDSHLNWMLSGEGGMTLFAPTDAAFQTLNREERNRLINNRQAFTNLLKSHLLRGTIYTVGLEDNETRRTENGKTLKFNVFEGGVSVNTIPVVYSDIPATNGVLHIIDQFL